MTITKIPVRTVFDNSNNPVGLAEFQVGEVIAIAQGGTSANTVANARVNLNITDANIRSLFSVTGGGSYSTSNGVIAIDSTDLTPFAKTVDLTTANVIELTNLYFTTARANTSIDNRVTKSFVDNLGIDATTLDGIDSTAFALDTDLTTANVVEVNNLYFSNARSILSSIPAVTSLSVTNIGAQAYLFDQYTGNNPNIHVTAGETISFSLNVNGHPFLIKEAANGSNFNTGLTHVANDGTITTESNAQAKVSGRLFFKVPFFLAGNTYAYQCSVHGGMVGNIVIEKPVSTITTTNVAEGNNLYFSNARSRSALSAGDGTIIYDPVTGEIRATANIVATIENTVNNLTTADVTENGINLYFTNARSVASLVGQSVTMGEATITGNLFVLGNVVEFNTETLIIQDKNIVLANGAASAAVANGAGITVDGAQANLIYLSTGDEWQFNKNLDVQGSISATGNITSPFYYSESDIVLKDDINPIKDPLKKLLKLVGVDFIWKSNKQKAIGVIAQDVEKILPEIVGKSNSGFKTVQYDSLIPLLIEAIKEQQKQIDDLRKKVK